ncbi:AfsR/SARP family transcriptional regulator [Mycolicibacterium vanbaalenii]|uniref:BTAD domain-containing putative transcriptional regulator n=1 Tax=Mycolicibacterium TaxID=1866885 RepID=UPI001F27AB53|nr:MULTISPECIES: BTAD domain-containing putative transcriptional regulator [Mycolicibacterium]MDW5614996.1 BTAD domain-containing putative transcriptional regulator [Mycolicibacterium sp. D5.8-2]UJL26854.1 AfsR/SARP family transcriptional regulator [Mycolicibacterium vanbaalenii]WND58976.1 BTAD domain-containing putative transcriptional regulator [Mycolicibacterium vanbaalenii]
MATELRLLGDVEVLVDGRRLDVGHARQRCVLVALLADVNQPVPAEQLIDRVWAGDPPHRVRNALAGYLSRLRALFAGSDEVTITREPGGYMLSTDPSAVDLHRFRRLVADARSSAEPARAADLFDEALSLWRGELCTTLDTPWVNELRTALEVERLSIVSERNDAALNAGRHAELLADLVAASRAHPLDERLAGQLMLAQYGSGRQAEALDTYRRTRQRLVDELGVDPSPTLRAAYQRILDGDSDRAPATPAVGAQGIPQADSLPRRVTSFIGRRQELAHIAAALGQGPLLTLTGVGGAGKTRLALEAATRHKARFGDGVWWCELAALADDAAVGHAVAGALRLQQRQGLDIDATVIEYLATRELLLVIDNCEHLLDAAAQLIDRIVARCPGVTVLATSREALGVAGERIMPVPPLPPDEASALFADRARAGRPDFDLDREPVGAVAEICRQLDGLPLAIELAAARIRVMGSLDLARRLDGLRLLSGGARGASPRQQSLAATIDWSYRLLSESEQQLFARLSVFAGGFDLAGAHGVCAEDAAGEEDTLALLTGLVEKSIVVLRPGTGWTRYSLLETLRAYGRNLLRENAIEQVYARRHAVYFTGLAERAAAGMHTVDEGAWVDRMLPDYDNLRVAFDRAMADGDVDLAMRLVTSLSEFGHLRVGYEASEWAERAFAVTGPDHPLFAAAVGFAARGAWNRGEDNRVRSLAALAGGRSPQRGNGRVAYPGDVLADVALYEGRPDVALAHYTAEMERARREADPIRLVWTLFYVAICYAALRTPEAGLHAAQEAVQVADTTANPTARSMAGYALGLVLKKCEPEQALALFDEAAQSAASVRNFWWQGIAMMEAAATRAVHGDSARAAGEFIAVLEHWDRVGDWSQQWLNLRYVTRLLVRLGATEDAAALHCALVKAGKPSPLTDTAVADLGRPAADGLSGVDAVKRAYSALARYR